MTKEQEVLKDLKEVTLEELDEAIKAVDKQEQEESLEKIKRQILIGECEKNIGIPVFISDLKNIFAMIEEKDEEVQFQKYIKKNELYRHKKAEKDLKGIILKQNKIIDLMSRYMLNLGRECIFFKDKETVKQYFENKAKEVE